MNQGTKRSILRWIHIIVTIPIFGYIYGPASKFKSMPALFGMSLFL